MLLASLTSQAEANSRVYVQVEPAPRKYSKANQFRLFNKPGPLM